MRAILMVVALLALAWPAEAHPERCAGYFETEDHRFVTLSECAECPRDATLCVICDVEHLRCETVPGLP